MYNPTPDELKSLGFQNIGAIERTRLRYSFQDDIWRYDPTNHLITHQEGKWWSIGDIRIYPKSKQDIYNIISLFP